MTSSYKNILSDFASYLSESGLIEKQAALDALQHSTVNNESYIDYLVRQKLLNESQMAKATAEYFGFPYCDINAFDHDMVPPEHLNMQLVRKRLALPMFKKGGLIFLAITDPTMEQLSEIRFLTGLDTRFFIVESSVLTKLIDSLLNAMILSEINETGGDDQLKNITVNAYKEDSTDLGAYDVESTPVVNYVNRILLDSISKGASDIHFERFEDNYRIRFRLHGVLYTADTPPVKLANYLLARIKVISDLDITEHRIPQDGRFKLILSKKRAIDFRVSVCPTVFGEKVVLRVLDPSRTFQTIEQLGMNKQQQESFLSALQNSQGMILVTGPTGSGKTVSLYSALNYLNSVEKNISTVEDPVEIPMQGVNQVHVNPKIGLTFSSVLRSFLRQDPDIIMVGEIRDLETAEIAVQASQTGHLVLSTLHTNSAPETVNRLMSMGVEPYNLASSLTIVIAQRLVRVLCDSCKQKEELSKDILLKEGFNKDELGTLQLYQAVGCDYCTNGYKGRVGIFEVMPISNEMKGLILKNGNTLEMQTLAKSENVMNLREAGLIKVKEGTVSLAELNRVFK
jgi:type IV pilus assembly protein PilB